MAFGVTVPVLPTSTSLVHRVFRRLELSVDVEIKSPHRGAITWLDMDRAEERYLLTGAANRYDRDIRSGTSLPTQMVEFIGRSFSWCPRLWENLARGMMCLLPSSVLIQKIG